MIEKVNYNKKGAKVCVLMKAIIECHTEGKLVHAEARCDGETTIGELLEKEFVPKCSAVCGRTVSLMQVKDVSTPGGEKIANWEQTALSALGSSDEIGLVVAVMSAEEASAWAAAYEAKKEKVVAALVQRGRLEISSGRAKDAWATFQSVRKFSPDNFDGLLFTVLLMVNTGIEARLREALELASHTAQLYPERFNIPVIIGDINMDLRNYAAAEEAYNKAYEMLKPMFEDDSKGVVGGTHARGNAKKGRGGKRATLAKEGAPKPQEPRVVGSDVVEVYIKAINRSAEAALLGGDIDRAETLLRRADCVEHRDSTLTELVRAAIDHARSEKVFAKKPSQSYEYALRAMRTRLGAVVSHPRLRETKDGFNESLGGRFGLRALYAALAGIDARGPAAAASFSMLGTLGRDQGNFEQCIDLYRHGLALRPDFGYCALHAAHCYEALARYNEAVRSHMDFFEANPGLGVFTATCANVLGVVAPLRNALSGSGRPAHPDMSIAPGTPQRFRVPPKGMTYTEDEISILGMYFTLVKYLYVMGYLQFVAPLTEIVRPLRENSDVHLTPVVNEAAYYGCIEKLAADLAPRLPLDTGCPTIYALGDSHTLAMGWHHVEAAGARYLLRPYLVTGIKAYHLRQNTRFYPKEAFWTMARTIPRGSYVVAVVGEIDCREAILSAVEKGGYRSVEEGVSETLRHYIPALVALVRELGLRVMVHPAPPVQAQQLAVIKAFNETLRDRIAALGDPSIKYLDVVDALVLEGWTAFNRKYELDGTHLRGNYVSEVLEPAINKVMTEWKEMNED